MWQPHARKTVLLILASATLSTGCAPADRPIAYRPQVEASLKLPCPRPVSPPPRGEATYLDILTFAVNAQIWGECNERKVIDLARSIEGQ